MNTPVRKHPFAPAVLLGLALLALASCTPPSHKSSIKPPTQTVQARVQASGTATYGGQYTYAGESIPQGYPHTLTKLVNQGYLLAYDEVRKNPAWAAYFIPAERKFGPLPRPTRFITDMRTTARVTHDDYTRSGFDRGHMAPNQAIASRFGEAAQRETFLMSNIVPQSPDLNQGPWRLLEDVLADTTSQIGSGVWVVVGPLYQEPVRRLPSGPAIPAGFFMVVAVETTQGPKLQAFVMNQSTARGDNFRTYVTTVDRVEELAQFDFFAELPDEIETALEAAPTPYWLEARNPNGNHLDTH